jgi:hypothetical protein
MCPLQRVLDTEAGPQALGLLLPPGRRTFLILRPRALAWDLLLETDDCTSFRLMPRGEAGIIAQKVYRALETWVAGGSGRLEAAPLSAGAGAAPPGPFVVRLLLGPFALVLCSRRPGQPYQPEVFRDRQTVQRALSTLTAALRPGSESVQEIYFNTRNFSV